MSKLLVALLLGATLLWLGPPRVHAAPMDYQVASGWFYSQAGGGGGRGFEIQDTGLDGRGQTIKLYSAFARLGGVSDLGYPASNRYLGADGFVYQATQTALLQWHAETDTVQLANLFDQLSQRGDDPRLLAMGIPPPIPNDGSGGNYAKAVQIRLAWLTNASIKAKFLANPNPAAGPWNTADAIDLYGLPTSLPVRAGPFMVQRFQRAAFQLWLDTVPGQPAAGTVVPILGGDLAKQFGLVPAAAQVGLSPGQVAPGQSPGVQAMAVLQPAVDLLRQYDQAHHTTYMQNLADHQVNVIVATISQPGELGYFSPDDNTIRINDTNLGEDAHDIADLIAHESSHALDYWGGVDITSVQGCYDTELTAFRHQADVWLWFYPGGKAGPADKLDQFLNGIANEVMSDPTGFVQQLTRVYHHQCTGS
ncbi:MAG TPA: hypothetical protein VMV93_09290 [Chloroflexota bacterium]|nr:hypothetical protein [Chloroflexota bacterium]